MKFDVVVPVRCEFCGSTYEFNITEYSRKATKINSNYSWVCPSCKSVANPVFACRMKWVSR